MLQLRALFQPGRWACRGLSQALARSLCGTIPGRHGHACVLAEWNAGLQMNLFLSQVEPSKARVVAVKGGKVLADSTRTWRVLETSHPPV